MMDPQLVVVALIIAVAIAFVTRQTIRTWAGGEKSGCSGGCGCARVANRSDTGSEVLIPVHELRVRQR